MRCRGVLDSLSASRSGPELFGTIIDTAAREFVSDAHWLCVVREAGEDLRRVVGIRAAVPELQRASDDINERRERLSLRRLRLRDGLRQRG